MAIKKSFFLQVGVKEDDDLVLQSNLHKKLQLGSVDENDSESSNLVKAESKEPKENKRKQKRTNRVNTDCNLTQEEEVDWNLDAEEERFKLETVKKEVVEKDFKLTSYKTMHIKQEVVDSEPNAADEESGDESGLVIDEKGDDNQENVINNSNSRQIGRSGVYNNRYKQLPRLVWHQVQPHARLSSLFRLTSPS